MKTTSYEDYLRRGPRQAFGLGLGLPLARGHVERDAVPTTCAVVPRRARI